MSDKDRIRLAEAIGWTRERRQYGRSAGWVWFDPDGAQWSNCPNPFEDANHDYAVLEWMREQHNTTDADFYSCGVRGNAQWHYQIGDYARAALKVIDND